MPIMPGDHFQQAMEDAALRRNFFRRYVRNDRQITRERERLSDLYDEIFLQKWEDPMKDKTKERWTQEQNEMIKEAYKYTMLHTFGISDSRALLEAEEVFFDFLDEHTEKKITRCPLCDDDLNIYKEDVKHHGKLWVASCRDHECIFRTKPHDTAERLRLHLERTNG